MGATTYAAMAVHWPNDSSQFAKPMNDIPKVVFSNSLTSADWDKTTISAGDLAESITRLKRENPGGYLLAHGFGGSGRAHRGSRRRAGRWRRATARCGARR